MKTTLLAFAFLLVCANSVSARAQTYTAVDLSGGRVATSISGGVSGGQGLGRATLWDLHGNPLDLHPAELLTSIILGRSGTLSVGYGLGPLTQNRAAAIQWNGSQASFLPLPFQSMASQAVATDGSQIVGQASPLTLVRDVPVGGPYHPIVWNAITGAVVADLYGGSPAAVLGVAGGQQVGYELKGATEARLWFGSAKGFINLHPKAYAASQANATDGVHQVGLVAQDVKVFAEKRGRTVRFDYAVRWSGSPASVTMLSAYPYSESNATGVSGDFISGYGITDDRYGTFVNEHAIGWVGPFQQMVDLHSLLPAGYTQSRATSVDSAGNFAGYATDSFNKVHAIVWVLNR